MQRPSGNTSGGGDTANTFGHGGQVTDSPQSAGSQAGASPDDDDADVEEAEEDSPAEPPRDLAYSSPPGASDPDDTVVLPEVRTVVSTDSAGMHALGAMACRFLTEQEAKRFRPQNWIHTGMCVLHIGLPF